MRWNLLSAAISQPTLTGRDGMPPRPSSANGLGAKRVHNTTPSGAGSPEATPSVNGSASKWLPVRAHPSGAAATPSAPRKNVRRLVFIA